MRGFGLRAGIGGRGGFVHLIRTERGRIRRIHWAVTHIPRRTRIASFKTDGILADKLPRGRVAVAIPVVVEIGLVVRFSPRETEEIVDRGVDLTSDLAECL